MSYNTIQQCATDSDLIDRVSACIAQEQLARDEHANPGLLVSDMIWAVSSASDVEAAYASALAADNPSPGGDESVISDGMILAHVQANWPAPDNA